MKEEKKEKNDKAIKKLKESFRFSDLLLLSKPELIVKYKALYKHSMDLAIQLNLALAKIERLEKEIEYLMGVKKEITYNDFDPQWGGIEKVLYILKQNKRPMLINEIETILLHLCPKFKVEWRDTRANTVRYVSRAVKYNLIAKIKDGGKYKYSLP